MGDVAPGEVRVVGPLHAVQRQGHRAEPQHNGDLDERLWHYSMRTAEAVWYSPKKVPKLYVVPPDDTELPTRQAALRERARVLLAGD